MFILEEPYVSDLMLKTLENNRFEVLENKTAKKYITQYDLNIINANDFINKHDKDLKIYSNSENSTDFVLKSFAKSSFAQAVKCFKDKAAFRKMIASVYPKFFFKEVFLEELESIDITAIKFPFIIKPAVGFLSIGVHKVNNADEWVTVVKKIRNEVKSFSKLFPVNVLNSSKFIIEEIIEGDEFAVDAYYDNVEKPVVLNIFQHPFVNSEDVSDRIYISSKKIIEENLAKFTDLLKKIGSKIELKNFPMHIEVIKRKDGMIIPVEINPMRCAGWCTTDLAYYAYGINIYEYFEKSIQPDWKNILKNKENEIYYFAMSEKPARYNGMENIEFEYDGFKKNFSDILEFRKINYLEKPLFAVVFGRTCDYKEVTDILKIDMNNYIKVKSLIF